MVKRNEMKWFRLLGSLMASAFREGGVEDGESVGGYWRGRKDFNRSPSRWTRKKGFVSSGIPASISHRFFTAEMRLFGQ